MPEFTCSLLISLRRAIVDQVNWLHEMLPLWSRCCQWTAEYTAHYGKNKPTSDSVHVVGECSSVVLEQNSEQDTLAALLVHSQSCGMTCSQLTLKWIRFGLVLIPRFALNIHYRTGFVFLLRFLNVRHSCVQVCSPIATGLFMSVPWELRPFFPPEE